ncbi:NEAT domain-containing protein [Paucilactobacillus kaifaensis]|uniref:NEAT domain-containing protein n=1 Tax=Paucilactobacillus kaifaensis TaxID=2559921 RepID=UPI0010F662DC|nr:NEAT domain-containing protein [Paucilactobacillus kaifaensis]
MKKRFLTLIAATILCFGIIIPSVGSVSALATDNTAATTTSQQLDPANLADGKYTINAPLMKEGKNTASLAQSYFDKKADLLVKDGKYSLTLHLVKNKSMVSDVTTVADNKPATVTSTGDQSEDLTFDIANLTNATTLSLAISIIPTMKMSQKMDVKPDVSTLALVQATSSSSEQSSTASEVESASSASSSATSENNASATTTQPVTDETTADETTVTPPTNEETNTATPALPIDPITPTNPTTTPDDTIGASDTDTTLTQAPLFDPANLSDGTYQVPVSVLKTGTETVSASASYFSDNATVVVSDNAAKVSVTLHVIKNASMITAFSIRDNVATISNKTNSSEDLTFAVDDQFIGSTVTANMAITIPGFNKTMNEAADLQFASALYVAPTDNTNNSNTTGTNNESNVPTNVGDLPTFDPNNLKDGQYKIDASILKSDSDDASLSASFFDPYATVNVSNDTKTVTVTLHVIKNASTIEKFSLDGQEAQVTNQTTDSEDLTFTVDDTFKDAIMNASMTIKVPVLNTEMTQQARVKFGTALFVGKTTDDNSSSTQTPTDNPDATPKQDTDYDVNNPKDGNYTIQAPIMSASDSSLKTSSAAQKFISKTATIIVSNNGAKVQLLLHITSGANYIKQMSIAGQSGKMINQSGDTADLIFNISNETLLGIGKVEFNLVTPLGSMNEPAYIIFNLSNKSLGTYKNQVLANTNAGSNVEKQSQHNIIDPNKDVQYVPYKVLDSSKTSLSTANNYYTKSAKVVKSGSGYDVYLTVKETAGMVQFAPLSINNGGILNQSHTTTGGQDVWSYAFHVANADGLDNLIPAQIMMSVPIAQITNQHFNIWLSFGKAQAGGIDYLNSDSTNALPASTLALVNSNNNSPTLLANTPNNHKKSTANNESTKNSNSENDKLASLKQYPLIAEIVGFSALALGIIGFTFYKKYRG